jgi:hypothetical protein
MSHTQANDWSSSACSRSLELIGVTLIFMERRSTRIFYALLAIWMLGVGYGMHRIWKYKTTPGVAADTPSSWPRDTKLVRAREGATLVMLAHPYCPCTRASVGELSQLMTQLQGKVTAYVVFSIPTEDAAEFEENDMYRTAAAIPGVTVVRDIGGVESERFGGKTSGQTYVFAAGGATLFSGGITGARGHAGDNAGTRRINDLVIRGISDRSVSPVFGCGLQDHEGPALVAGAGGEERP